MRHAADSYPENSDVGRPSAYIPPDIIVAETELMEVDVERSHDEEVTCSSLTAQIRWLIEFDFYQDNMLMEVDEDSMIDLSRSESPSSDPGEGPSGSTVGPVGPSSAENDQSYQDEDEEAEECENLLWGLQVETPHSIPATPDLVVCINVRSAAHLRLITLQMSDDTTDSAPTRRRNPRRRAARSSSSTSLPDPIDLLASTPRIAASRTHSGVNDQLVPAMDDVRIADFNGDPDIEVMTWKTHGIALAMEFADPYARAKDIPHELQDQINAMQDYAKRAEGYLVNIFEGSISANTAQDEPHAPPIKIINYVDDDPTPPFEFYYSNKMWHSEKVPKPDLENLQGCDCQGRCEPSSKSCSCIKRQVEQYKKLAIKDTMAYDSRGRMKHHGIPIFECNMKCGCDDDCRNRASPHHFDLFEKTR